MSDLAGRNILVWGIGRHGGGVAAARFCAARGARVTLLDQRPPADLGVDGEQVLAQGWPWVVGDASHPAFARADLVVASPAIPPRAWPARHPPVASPEGLFCAAHRGPRLAVTGTKGKSTTALIAGSLLGWAVGGNSYEPLLDLLARHGPEAPLVCELSSFQLWYLRAAPPRFDAAIVTNLTQDHLDWHPDLAHYRAAKLALLEWSGCAALGEGLHDLAPASVRLLPAVRCVDGVFTAGDGTALARRSDLDLLGDHNGGNACLALAAAGALGVPRERLAERLRAVRALPHRLQTVHVCAARGLAFVDDSIATTPESAIAGLAAVPGPLAVILGGSDKGAAFAALADAVAARGALPQLIGRTAPALAAVLAARGVAAPIHADLDAAVAAALASLPGGGSVLLSPACASFDMFRGFEHRGERFAAAARRLAP